MVLMAGRWRKLAAASALAALCWALLGALSSRLPNPGGTNSLGLWFTPHPMNGLAASLWASEQRAQRSMLQRGAGPQQPLFDPVPAIPVNLLTWLKEPAGGWPVWQLPAGGDDSVGVASVASVPSKSVQASQLVVLQALSHLNTADVAQDANYDPSSDSSGSRPGRRTRLLLEPGDPSRRLLATGDDTNSSQAAAASLVAAAAASKPALRQRPRLASIPTFPNVVHRYPSMPAPFNGRLPPTGLVVRASTLPSGCPLSGSVKRFGARGNGASSDTQALRNANGSKSTRFLFFPPGTYRITGKLVLTKPVVMGAGTKFKLDTTAVLVLQQQPRRAPIWYDPLFVGSGRVQMGAAVKEVYPGWWSDYRKSGKWQALTGRLQSNFDDLMLQLALKSCVQACTIVQTRTLFLQKSVLLSPNAGHFSTANAGIVAARKATGKGLVLPGGTYKRPMVFTSIRGFPKFGLAIAGGVRNANIQTGHLSSNGVGIAFQGIVGRPIHNVTLSNINIMQSNQQSVVFNSPSPNTLFSGITVRINFLLTGGFTSPTKPSYGLLFRGSAPKLQNTQVIVQAIDPAQFLKVTKFAAVATVTKAPVSNVVFRSDVWNGGYMRPGTQVSGAFKHSKFQFRFSDTVGGSIFNFKAGSGYNWLSKNEAAAPSAFWALVRSPGTLAQFIAANPRAPPQPSPMQFAGPSIHQSFYVTFKTDVAWRPGLQRTYYLHSYFSDPATNLAQMSCIAYQQTNPGLYCASVKPAPMPNQRHRVAIKLVNLSRKVIPAGMSHWFGVQVGPSFTS